jgi:hypothetical protein
MDHEDADLSAEELAARQRWYRRHVVLFAVGIGMLVAGPLATSLGLGRFGMPCSCIVGGFAFGAGGFAAIRAERSFASFQRNQIVDEGVDPEWGRINAWLVGISTGLAGILMVLFGAYTLGGTLSGNIR